MADRGIDRTLWLLLPAVIFVVALFVYPFIYGLSLSLTPGKDAPGIFGNYAKFFADPYYSSTIWLTLRLAIPATLFNTLASVPFAYWTIPLSTRSGKSCWTWPTGPLLPTYRRRAFNCSAGVPLITVWP